MRDFIHYIGTVESPTPVGSVHTMSMTSALPSVAGIPLVAGVALKASNETSLVVQFVVFVEIKCNTSPVALD